MSNEYQKGYQAGLRRKRREQTAAQREVRDRAFWERAFLAALPVCVDAQGWRKGGNDGTPIVDQTQRTELAAGFADDALNCYRARFQ